MPMRNSTSFHQRCGQKRAEGRPTTAASPLVSFPNFQATKVTPWPAVSRLRLSSGESRRDVRCRATPTPTVAVNGAPRVPKPGNRTLQTSASAVDAEHGPRQQAEAPCTAQCRKLGRAPADVATRHDEGHPLEHRHVVER